MAKGTLAIARPQSCIFRLDFSKKIQLLTDLLSCKMTEAQIFSLTNVLFHHIFVTKKKETI